MRTGLKNTILCILVVDFIILHVTNVVSAQAVPGGGGGDGDGGDDGGGRDAGPICSLYCHKCSSYNTCDVCYSGYTQIQHKCHACAGHCYKCDVSGPGYCDWCERGFMLDFKRCKACPDQCSKCHYVFSSSSLDNTKDYNSIMSIDSQQQTCDACVWLYRLEDTVLDDIPVATCVCKFRLLGLNFCRAIKICTFFICFVLIRLCGDATNRKNGLVEVLDQKEYVLQDRENSGHSLPPSGIWRGYYTYHGNRHNVCEFNLEFRRNNSNHLGTLNPGTTLNLGTVNDRDRAMENNNTVDDHECTNLFSQVRLSNPHNVSGSGVDDVGSYTINGFYFINRIAFSKTYQLNSRNLQGVVHYGNVGHTVEYRGQLCGESLGSGVRGMWSIRHATHGSMDERFHLWPGMEGWQDIVSGEEVNGEDTICSTRAQENSLTDAFLGNRRPTNSLLVMSGSDDRIPSNPQKEYVASFEDCECIVCLDRVISTCLRPCRHVALCGICASKLNPRVCPVCRAQITSIENRSQKFCSSR